jgi:hypothetical protein
VIKKQVEATPKKSIEDEPCNRNNILPLCIYISSDSKINEKYKLDKNDDKFFDDIKTVLFNNYLN